MGVRVIVFREHGTHIESGALLWDSTTGYPLTLQSFATGDDAGDFLDYMDDMTDVDLRAVPVKELQAAQEQWFKDHPPD